jgi:primary-amine oxidase
MKPRLALALFGLIATLAALSLPTLLAEPKPAGDAKSGSHVEWEGWSFNWSFRPREGLVLTDVFYRGRKVLKYAGLAELLTVYDQGDPRPRDFNQGYRILTLAPGLDCSSGESCRVFDKNGQETGKDHPAQVMLHEEKTGPNYLGNLGRVPGKTLVLWTNLFFNGGLDGYTFVVRWKFRDDGTLIPEVGASGVPQHLRIGDSSPTGSFIGYNDKKDRIFAPSHVHNFLYRLDFDVDGTDNVVEEFNREPDDSRNGAKAKCTWTPIVTETGRPLNAATYRSWRVVNRASKNALGHVRSYQLLPGSAGVFRSGLATEAAAQADLWVTLFKPDEMGGMDGLAKYADGEAVENKDVVLWYWLSLHHLPRSEDWQHQPMVWKSFELMPRDFLDESPMKEALK